MRVLITGGNGFVGKAIIKKLLEERYEVWALLNENSELRLDSESENKCKIINADIRNPISIKKLPANLEFDAAIHSAGLAHQFGKRDEKDFRDVNVTGTQNVLEAAIKLSIRQFILISSVAVYGDSPAKKNPNAGRGLDETAKCFPIGVYASTKLESEKIAHELCELNNISLLVLRLATVIGENDRGNVFRLIETIKKRKFIWIGDGRNRKSLIYKGDIARACAEVLKYPEKQGIYNLSGEIVLMKDIVSEIYRSMERKAPEFRIPAKLLMKLLNGGSQAFKIEFFRKLAATVEKWCADECFSSEKFQCEFDFEMSVTIAEALRREVKSYLQTK